MAEVRRADELGDEVYDPEEKNRVEEHVETASVPGSDDHVFTENEIETEHSSSEFEHLNRPQSTSKSTSNAKVAYPYANQLDNEMSVNNVPYQESIAGIISKIQHRRSSYSQNESEWNSNVKEVPRSAGISVAHGHHHNGNISTPKSANQANHSMFRYD